jgi:hypothetical protein
MCRARTRCPLSQWRRGMKAAKLIRTCTAMRVFSGSTSTGPPTSGARPHRRPWHCFMISCQPRTRTCPAADCLPTESLQDVKTDTPAHAAVRASRYVHGPCEVNGLVRRCPPGAVTCISRLRPWLYGARMGRDLGCPFVRARVSTVTPRTELTRSHVRIYYLQLVPPTRFERAHTAPECIPLQRCDQGFPSMSSCPGARMGRGSWQLLAPAVTARLRLPRRRSTRRMPCLRTAVDKRALARRAHPGKDARTGPVGPVA